MPSPCTPWSSQTFGPIRVQLTLAAPIGYTEAYNQPDTPPPLGPVSEITQALHDAVDSKPAEITVMIEDLAATNTPPRIATVQVGGGYYVEARGSGISRPSPTGPTSEPVDVPYQDTWTVELCVDAPDAPSANVLDYTEIARLWMAQLTEITVISGSTLTLSAHQGLYQAAGAWTALPDGYPESSGRRITVVTS